MGAVSTTDVVTNADTSGSTPTRGKNGTIVVSCTPTGTFHTIDAQHETSLTYTALENLFTTRMDEIVYYNAVDGGTP